MKKFLSNIYTLAALLIAGATFTACSSNDDIIEQPANPTEPQIYTLVIKASKGDTNTRALKTGTDAESGKNTVVAYWSGEETIEVYQSGEKIGTATAAASASGNTTITATLNSAPDPAKDLNFYLGGYTPDYTGQVGLLTGTNSISEKYDYAMDCLGSGTYTVDNINKKVTPKDGSLPLTFGAASQTIIKFTLQDKTNNAAISPSALTVTDGTNTVELTSIPATTYTANGDGVLYVAFQPSGENKTITLTATVGSDTYTYTTSSSKTFYRGWYYEITVKMSRFYDLSATANANTYIVSSPGKYRFDATVKGNGGLDPMTSTTATKISKSDIAGVKVLWELFGQGRAIKHDGTKYDISYDDGYVYFSTPSTFVSGNCYVAVVDASDNILWSWLIWATPEPGEQTADSEKFMDRNLGSINVEYCSRGFLYQWGRKDPFPSTKYNNDIPYDYVPARMTCHGLTNASQSVSYTILHPTTFIYNVAWVTENDYKTNLWSDTEKTIYDPCPAGWRVPTNSQMATFHSKIGLGTLPDTGFIGNCSHGDFGYGNPSTGYYWSSTGVNKSNAKAFCNDTRSNIDWPINEGYAIRPVKE